MEGKCPRCKEVRVRAMKGKTFAKWEMKCPDCKKKSQEWLTQHCDTCDVDFLACPICKKGTRKRVRNKFIACKSGCKKWGH